MSGNLLLFPLHLRRHGAYACFTLMALTGTAHAILPSETGMIDITKAPYNVIVNDGKDDAPKIKQAILDVTNSSKKDFYAKTLYFPVGTYDIGSKIVAQEKRASGEGNCGSHVGRGTIVMVGETNGATRPVFKLMKSIIPTSKSGPMLDIRNQEVAGCGFRNGFRGINIDLTATGNAGAIGLKFDAAQDSFLEDVKVDATNATAGIIAIPGASMAAANIEVVGGKYGIQLLSTSLGSSLVGVKLTGQTEVPLTSNIYRGISVTGIEIETGAPQAILLSGGAANGYPGHLSLYDASIKFNGNGTRTAISNTNNHAVALTNVYTSNANLIVDRGNGVDDLAPRTPGSTEHVLSYVVAPRGISNITGVYRITTPSGTATTTASNATDALNLQWGTATSLAPGDLRSRHLWDKTYSFSDNLAVIPTWPAGFNIATSDARGPIQTAIDDAVAEGKTVFLPAGKYLISGPLTLHANTKLIGVPGLRTELKPNGWVETATATFVIETDDAPDGTTVIQDMAFDTPKDANALIGGMHWRAGRYSLVRRVRTLLDSEHRETDKRDFLIDGSGGGRWYSLADHTNIPNILNPVNNPVNCNYRKLLVSGTTQPLSFYGLNLERGGTKKKRTQYPLGELRDAQNVRVFGQKMEIDGAEADAPPSTNACNNQRTDQPLDKGVAWDINGATDNVFFAMTFSNDVTTEAPLIRVASGVTRIALDGAFVVDQGGQARMFLLDENASNPGVITRLQWLGLFSRGAVDHSEFLKHIPPPARRRK